MIGYFGYDLAPLLERLPRRVPRDSRFPDIRLALYDTAVVVDHQTGEAALRAWDVLGEGARAVDRRCARWLKTLQADSQHLRPIPRSRLGPVVADLDRADYLDRVGRVLEYIAAGDVFQANFTQRFTSVGRPEPLDLYLRLKTISPAPFSAFLGLDSLGDNLAVVSASPEWFYQTRGDRILTRPIKGTRPRGVDPAQDRRLADELARSAKDRAELTMIVDLERNDLGRVCRYGTVRVLDPLAVESYAQVHHLVATVEGRLRAGVRPIDVVRGLFPGGSITGAPKIRAMEVIDELEPNRRGVYTGAIGYLSRGGSSGFNIAIRTLLVEGDRVRYQVGGGIVADSDPEAEYEETLDKGRGLRAVIAGEGDLP
jgi:para-aminobenzoate synthetase component 1